MQKKYFITYGTNEFNIQKRNLLYLAKKSENFDTCIGFSQKNIDKNFYKEFLEILNLKKGGGYWIWKYYIIKKLLNEINENDILVYSDAGSSFNPKGMNRLNEYFEMLNDDPSGNLRFQIEFKEKYWTNKEVFNYFNIPLDSSIANTGQLLGGHLIFKKNINSVNIFNEFEKLLKFDSKLITDFYSENQIDGFKEHRHDQSILSILSKIYGAIILKDETYFEKNPNEQFKFPFLAVRKRKYDSWQKLKFYLLYPIYVRKTIYFGKDLYFYQKPSLIKRIKYKFSK